jgi:hypothetical protein
MPQSAVHFLPIMGACCFGGIGSSETSTRVFILHWNGSSSLVSPQLSRQSRQRDPRIPDLIPYELGGIVDPVPAFGWDPVPLGTSGRLARPPPGANSQGDACLSLLWQLALDTGLRLSLRRERPAAWTPDVRQKRKMMALPSLAIFCGTMDAFRALCAQLVHHISFGR